MNPQPDMPMNFQIDSTHIAVTKLESGMAMVFITEFDGVFTPVEIRFLNSMPILNPSSMKEMTAYIRRNSETIFSKSASRIPGHMLRELSLTDVVSTLRKYVDKQRNIEARYEYPLKMTFSANASDFGFRNLRDFKAAKERIQAATIYVKALASGDTKPVLQVASELGIDISRARSLIAGARRDGFLTSEAQGTLGGALTERGRDFIELLTGEKK